MIQQLWSVSDNMVDINAFSEIVTNILIASYVM